MSMVKLCPRCGAQVTLPAYPGDGVYAPEHACTQIAVHASHFLPPDRDDDYADRAAADWWAWRTQ